MRRAGSGNFVATRIEKNFAKLTSFSEDMRSRGRTPRSVWLKRSAGTVTPEEALRLRLSPGTPVYRFNRIRYADDVPMCLEYATIAASALPSLEAVDNSLYEALEAHGNRPVRALQRLSRAAAERGAGEAAAIEGGRCGPVRRTRSASCATARPSNICRSYFRGDIYDFVAELSAG